jgi:hypothetical protein
MALSLLAEVMGWPEDDQAVATHEYAWLRMMSAVKYDGYRSLPILHLGNRAEHDASLEHGQVARAGGRISIPSRAKLVSLHWCCRFYADVFHSIWFDGFLVKALLLALKHPSMFRRELGLQDWTMH